MTGYDDARENVVWGAADAFLSNNLDEILDEVFERVYEEETDDLEGIVEEVVSEWLSRSYVYDQIQTYIDEQIDDECMYSDDCMDIITDYGFSESLSAALEMGCDLSDVSESAVASAVLTLHGPTEDTMQDEIIRQIQETTAFRERAEVAGF